MKKFTLVALAAFAGMISITAKAQNAKKPFIDTTATFEHFISLQANALVQQIINFGEPSDLLNPYVVKYTLKHRATGLVFNIAGGISGSSLETDNGLITENESYDLRVGLGYQKSVTDRLEIGVGADLIQGRSYKQSSSISTIVFGGNIDSTTTTLRDKQTYFGGGVQLNISYKLTPTLLLGTEASFYAFSTEEIVNSVEDNFIIRDIGSSEDIFFRNISSTNETTDGNEIQLNLPIVLFLILRF